LDNLVRQSIHIAVHQVMYAGIIAYVLFESCYADPQRVARDLHDVRTYCPRFI